MVVIKGLTEAGECNFNFNKKSRYIHLQRHQLCSIDLSPIRDFTDVKDMVRGYYLALLKAKSGEVYNVGSGKGISIQELLDTILDMAKVKVEVKTDQKRVKPADVPVLVSNYDKFNLDTGWQPEIPLKETVERVLHYWRNQISNNIQEKNL